MVYQLTYFDAGRSSIERDETKGSGNRVGYRVVRMWFPPCAEYGVWYTPCTLWLWFDMTNILVDHETFSQEPDLMKTLLDGTRKEKGQQYVKCQ